MVIFAQTQFNNLIVFIIPQKVLVFYVNELLFTLYRLIIVEKSVATSVCTMTPKHANSIVLILLSCSGYLKGGGESLKIVILRFCCTIHR